MKTMPCLIVLLTVLAAAAGLHANDTSTALRTDARNDFLPEGLTWDATHRRFLLGSIRLHRIDGIDPASGHAQRFADAPGSVLGMQISPDGRSVWAAWTIFAGNFHKNRGTGIAAWSLADGRRLDTWTLPENDPHATLGDLLVLDDRTIVTSDSGTGAIYRFDMAAGKYFRIVDAGVFAAPQGIARGRDKDSIYLADYATGIWRIDLADGARHRLSAPPPANLRGIDGLYRSGDALIGVQNGTPKPNILRMALGPGDTIERVDTLATARPAWDEPTLGVVVGDRFWFNAASQWSRFDGELRPRTGVKLQSPLLDSVTLPLD